MDAGNVSTPRSEVIGREILPIAVCYCPCCGTVWCAEYHEHNIKIAPGIYGYKPYVCELCKALEHRFCRFNILHYQKLIFLDKLKNGKYRLLDSPAP